MHSNSIKQIRILHGEFQPNQFRDSEYKKEEEDYQQTKSLFPTRRLPPGARSLYGTVACLSEQY